MTRSLLIAVLVVTASLGACGKSIDLRDTATPVRVAEPDASRGLAPAEVDRDHPADVVRAGTPIDETAAPPMPAATPTPSSAIHSLITLRNTPCWVPYC